MTYQFRDPEKRLDAWLETEPSTLARTRVLTWILELISDPDNVEATAVPITMGLPLWTAIVPGTSVALTWTLMKSPPYPEHLAGITLRRIESAF